MLAHVAEAEGEAAARNAVAELRGEAPDALDRPGVRAGRRLHRARHRRRGLDARRRQGARPRRRPGRLKFAGNGKALAEGHADGFVQLVAENGTGRILGCQIVGPHAAELIQEVSIPMAAGMTVAELGHCVFGHPTVSEVIMFAAREAAEKTGTAH